MNTRAQTKNDRPNGFTLVELMVTLSVLVILTTIAVPSFQRAIANNRAAVGANELLAALQLARSEAVRRNSNASLCPSTNGTECTGGTDWSGGWILFHDVAGNGDWDTGVDELLRVGSSLSPAVSIDGPLSHMFANTGVSPAVVFDLSVSGGGNPERCVEVIASGATRVLQGSCI